MLVQEYNMGRKLSFFWSFLCPLK